MIPTSGANSKRRLQNRSSRWTSIILLLSGFLMVCSLVFSGCGSLDRSCENHEDCDLGFYCNPTKLCKPGCRFTIECEEGEICSFFQCIKIRNDADQDGFHAPIDCNDKDPLINPGVREICDNKIDDNCNKKIDEAECVRTECRPGESRECYDGKEKTLTFTGTRCRKGRQTCNAGGVWGDCQGQVIPTLELCDGIDSDCDGQIDEDDKGKPLQRPCYTGDPSLKGIGNCQEGVQVCDNKVWQACKGDLRPTKETCNGKDDDCNGEIDNLTGIGDACDTGEKGNCKVGKRQCDPKKQSIICQPLQQRAKEICGDNQDNDCDGFIDNGCRFSPRKIADVRSFPHYIATDGAWLIISVKDTKEVVVYKITNGKEQLHKTIKLPEEPYGIAIEGKSGYVTTEKKLFQLDLNAGTAKEWVVYPKFPQSAGLAVHGGRIYSRYWAKNTRGQNIFGICRTETSTPKVQCGEIVQESKLISSDIIIWKAFALLASDRGLHFIHLLDLKEDLKKQLTAPTGAQYMAVDTSTDTAILSVPSKNEVHIYDLQQGKSVTKLTPKDGKGTAKKPGNVATAKGLAYVSHNDGQEVSLIDLKKQSITKVMTAGTAPAGLAIGPYDQVKGATIWLTCPGDNTLWTFQTTP